MRICHWQEGCISRVWGICSIIHGLESVGVEGMVQNGDEISVQWALDLKTAFLFFMIFSWPISLHILLTHPDIFRFSYLRAYQIIGYFCITYSVLCDGREFAHQSSADLFVFHLSLCVPVSCADCGEVLLFLIIPSLVMDSLRLFLLCDEPCVTGGVLRRGPLL